MKMRVLACAASVAVGFGGGGCSARRADPDAARASSAPSTVAAPAATARAAPGSTTPVEEKTPGSEVAPVELGEALRELFAVAACGDRSLPQRFGATKDRRRCARLEAAYADYRSRWLSRSEPFFTRIRPDSLPRAVVYPFGGGDLVTAMTVFPDADEFTTISLEPSGDVRRIEDLPVPELERSLEVSARHLRRLLRMTYSRTTHLDAEGRSALPGEVVFILAALAVHGYVPTGGRYFSIAPDGALHYATRADLDAADGRPHAPGFRPPSEFSNVEIRFQRAAGGGPERVVRHIAQDLSDPELGKAPGLVTYLSAKGKVAAMTKAASHLLWADDFSVIRGYLLSHVEWMVSDSTGIPPRFASPAGFVQVPYGLFETPARFGPIETEDARGFRHLFASSHPEPLRFQFGYLDGHHHPHLVVTKRASGRG